MYFLLFGIQMSHTVNDFMSLSAASTLNYSKEGSCIFALKLHLNTDQTISLTVQSLADLQELLSAAEGIQFYG